MNDTTATATATSTAPAPADPVPMRLLVVVDESPAGLHTAAIAVDMAVCMRAELLFQIALPFEPIDAHSAESVPSALEAHRALCRARTLPRFTQVMAMASAAGVPSRTTLTIDEEPSSAVIRVVQEQACDLVIVGTVGRGPLSQLIHASLAAKLARMAPRPVMVCRHDVAFGSVGGVGADGQAAKPG